MSISWLEVLRVGGLPIFILTVMAIALVNAAQKGEKKMTRDTLAGTVGYGCAGLASILFYGGLMLMAAFAVLVWSGWHR